MDELVIPQSVKEAIGHRLDRVSQECNELLRLGAILGKVFSFDELTAAAEQTEDALLDALDEATGAQLLAPISGESFSFTHDKIREVLYEELNPIRRRRLHRHVAEGIERHRDKFPARSRSWPIITSRPAITSAVCNTRNRQPPKRNACLLSTRRSRRTDARSIARKHWASSPNNSNRKKRSARFMLHGETVLAGEHFERALALATDQTARVRLQCQVAASLVTTGDTRGLEYLREALEVLDPSTDPLETAMRCRRKHAFITSRAGTKRRSRFFCAPLN